MLRPLPLNLRKRWISSGRFYRCSAQSLTVGVAGYVDVVGLHRVDGRGTRFDVFGGKCMEELVESRQCLPAL